MSTSSCIAGRFAAQRWKKYFSQARKKKGEAQFQDFLTSLGQKVPVELQPGFELGPPSPEVSRRRLQAIDCSGFERLLWEVKAHFSDMFEVFTTKGVLPAVVAPFGRLNRWARVRIPIVLWQQLAILFDLLESHSLALVTRFDAASSSCPALSCTKLY